MFFENHNNECWDEWWIIIWLGIDANKIRKITNSKLIKELDFPSDENEDDEDIDEF